jgi:hypothetical protein
MRSTATMCLPTTQEQLSTHRLKNCIRLY